MVAYLQRHPEVTDVLFTGGDPMIMKTAVPRRWVDPLLAPNQERIRALRFGTNALSYWPARFTAGTDADDLLRLFERCVAVGPMSRKMAIDTSAIAAPPVERQRGDDPVLGRRHIFR